MGYVPSRGGGVGYVLSRLVLSRGGGGLPGHGTRPPPPLLSGQVVPGEERGRYHNEMTHPPLPFPLVMFGLVCGEGVP